MTSFPTFDSDCLVNSGAIQDVGTPVSGIARKLTIKTGKNTGGHPPVASVY